DALRSQLRAALRESTTRVVMVSVRTVAEKARRIVLSLTSDYLRNPSRPAPVLLRLMPQPVEFRDLVATAFDARRVPFSRFDFPGLLAEGAFLPVFTVDALRSALNPSSGAKAALQVLARGGKVVLVTSEEVKPEELARHWGMRASNIRTLPRTAPPTGRGKGPLPPPSGGQPVLPPPPGDRFDRGRALLVGVANYPRVSQLPESVLNDARDIAALLRSPIRCGYPESNVEVLLDQQATAQRFRFALQRLAQTTSPDDTVVIYFSGHGAREINQGRVEAYLLPFDSDPDDLERTALSASELSRLLAAIRASRLVVLLDACHAAGAAHLKTAKSATFKSGLDDKTYEALGRGTGRVVMASSRADEPSRLLPGMKNSLFTAYLLEALDGTAKNHGDDVIRVLDVFHHIAENVPRRAPQHPILKAQDVENNFAIALNLRTKQASPLPSAPSHEVPYRVASPLPPKARLAVSRGLVRRWQELAVYLGVPLQDKVTFDRGRESHGVLEWLEERGRLGQLRDAFIDLGWTDLVDELDRHSS
ncbi:MAG TPA: caspase family protein, partial [Polyangiaceae bacterium]|nr:caspase family protein [Polyangiaceae bacterium]